MYDDQKFLEAISSAFKNYKEKGSRSPKKLEPIHKYLGEVLKSIFGDLYSVHFLGEEGEGNKEIKVEGKYYPKQIDITVTRDSDPIFCLGFKFVTSNYKQNANNYFENMMGETANIQRQDLPYGQIIVLRHKTPYYKKDLEEQRDKKSQKTEIIKQKDLQKYVNLVLDDRHTHRPFAIGILLIDIDEESEFVQKIEPNSVFEENNFSEVLTDKVSIENLFRQIEEFAENHKANF